MLSAPQVTTLSGRQTHLACQDMVTLPPSFGVKEPLPVGQVLDVLPEVRPDGYTIDLVVISSVTQLSTNQVTPLKLRQMAGQYALRDGQTLMLAGVQAGKETENNRKLLVFITATLIDPAGNLLHSEEEIRKYSSEK